MVYVLSRLTIDGDQKTTQQSTYKKEISSEINKSEELPKGVFPINLKSISQYQRKNPSLIAKYKWLCQKTVIFVEEVI